MVTPAAIDTTCLQRKGISSFISSITSFTFHGFTTNISMSAFLVASMLSVVVSTSGNSPFNKSNFSVDGSDTQILYLPREAKPLATAPPIFPTPMIDIFIFLAFLLQS